MSITRNTLMDRLLAGALLLAALLAVYVVMIAPIAEYMQSTRASITEQRTLLGRLRADLDRSPANGSHHDVASSANNNIFLPGGSAATRVANLQARLGALVADANVAILSARAVTPETRDGLAFAGVEISFRASDSQLQSLLSAIERDRPFLFVEGLQMTPSPDQSGDGQAASSQNDVTLRIAGAVEQIQG